MAHIAIMTSSGVVKGASGQIYSVGVTKPATGAGSVLIYDNPTTNSGGLLFQGDGLAESNWDVSNGNGTGVTATQGIFVQLAGTTNATVIVVYD